MQRGLVSYLRESDGERCPPWPEGDRGLVLASEAGRDVLILWERRDPGGERVTGSQMGGGYRNSMRGGDREVYVNSQKEDRDRVSTVI